MSYNFWRLKMDWLQYYAILLFLFLVFAINCDRPNFKKAVERNFVCFVIFGPIFLRIWGVL